MSISICVLTCDRPSERTEYALKTIASLRNLLTEEPLALHIADDGSNPRHLATLLAAIPKAVFDSVTHSNSDAKGYGGNYNNATQVIHGSDSDLVLPLEDDWTLERELDLTPIAAVLRSGLFDCVRLGYVGWTNRLSGSFVGAEGLTWLALDPDSEELHVFAGGPRLETVEFERRLGPWPEGLAAGATEIEVCNRPESRIGVAWPVDLVKPCGDLFSHVGTEKAVYE